MEETNVPSATHRERAEPLDGAGGARRIVAVGGVALILALFVAVNLRRLGEPFRDYVKPFAGEPFYAIRSLNYLRHGYWANWLGVCDNLNPRPDRLVFKFTEMPGFFVVNSIGFRVFGTDTLSFRLVELGYACLLLAFFVLAARRLWDGKTALLAGTLMVLLPLNMFLLYTAWIFLFPLAALFFYNLWHESRSNAHYSLMLSAVALGCLHHVAGYFAAPAMLAHSLLAKSFRRNLRGLAGVFGVSVFLGAAFLGQIFLLRHHMETLAGKAFRESIINVPYLRTFFAQQIGKLPPNYHELLTAPMMALGLGWLVRAIRKRPGSGDRFVLLTLLFPAMFFFVFLGMVASHLHFLALFGPFLTLASCRLLMDNGLVRDSRLRWLVVTGLVLYLGFMGYKTHHKYDAMAWNPYTERGYRLGHTLREMTDENESIAGLPDFGYGYHSMSPAFYFYLRRNYYGGITDLKQFVELTKSEKVSLFLLPSKAPRTGDENANALREYLLHHHTFFVAPDRNDMMIFDLRASSDI